MTAYLRPKTYVALYRGIPALWVASRRLPPHKCKKHISQKVERLRLTFPSSFPALLGIPPEHDPARLVGVEFQAKLLQPSLEISQETVGFRLVLET